MNFVLDVHVHTINSTHAYSTVSENAAHAAKIDLPYIGIADHAPAMPGGAHIYHFTNLWSLPKIINGVRVFKGVECNILNTKGELDLDADLLAKMEFVIASFHRGVFPPADRDTHTRAAVAAMENNPDMHIFGHPGGCLHDICVKTIVETAARTRTIIEINNASLNPNSTRFDGQDTIIEILKYCKELRVPVLASSDAHFCTYVGDMEHAKKLIIATDIPEKQVLNTSVERFLAAIKVRKEMGVK